MGTAARNWAALLLLAAVFLGHGLQCAAAGSTTHTGDVVAMVDHQAAPTVEHAAPDGAAHGHPHGLPGHLMTACLAVLVAGLALLLTVAPFRSLRSRTGLPGRPRGPSRSAVLRPPDLAVLCVLRT